VSKSLKQRKAKAWATAKECIVSLKLRGKEPRKGPSLTIQKEGPGKGEGGRASKGGRGKEFFTRTPQKKGPREVQPILLGMEREQKSEAGKAKLARKKKIPPVPQKEVRVG